MNIINQLVKVKGYPGVIKQLTENNLYALSSDLGVVSISYSDMPTDDLVFLDGFKIMHHSNIESGDRIQFGFFHHLQIVDVISTESHGLIVNSNGENWFLPFSLLMQRDPVVKRGEQTYFLFTHLNYFLL